MTERATSDFRVAAPARRQRVLDAFQRIVERVESIDQTTLRELNQSSPIDPKPDELLGDRSLDCQFVLAAPTYPVGNVFVEGEARAAEFFQRPGGSATFGLDIEYRHTHRDTGWIELMQCLCGTDAGALVLTFPGPNGPVIAKYLPRGASFRCPEFVVPAGVRRAQVTALVRIRGASKFVRVAPAVSGEAALAELNLTLLLNTPSTFNNGFRRIYRHQVPKTEPADPPSVILIDDTYTVEATIDVVPGETLRVEAIAAIDQMVTEYAHVFSTCIFSRAYGTAWRPGGIWVPKVIVQYCP